MKLPINCLKETGAGKYVDNILLFREKKDIGEN